MQSSHTPTRRFTPVFDEDHLVSAGGLPAVMGLAQRAGLADLMNERLTVASPNAVVKTRALVTGMLAGADDIDGMDVLRSGGTAKVVGAVRAPSTLGTFLRSFTHGHTLQLGAINRQLLANLAPRVPTLFGSDELVMVDDDAICRAMLLMFNDLKLAVEPAAAVTTAAMTGPLGGGSASLKDRSGHALPAA